MSMGLFKNVTYKLFTNHIYLIYKKGSGINNLQGLICHKIQNTDPFETVYTA